MISNTGKGLSKFMQRQFTRSLQTAETATERITTGKRINRAADDVGAFFMSSQMHAHEKSQRMALGNIEKGLALIERTDQALDEVHNIMSRMHELAVQASSDVLNSSDRSAVAEEFDGMIETLDKIANTAKYGSSELLKSSYVDLGLLVDVSGSMSSIINEVANSINNVAQSIRSANIELRLGVAELGGDPIDNVDKTADFTDTQAVFDNAVEDLRDMTAENSMDPYTSLIQLSSAANDDPGKYEEDAFSWKSGSSQKFIAVITDTNRETTNLGYTEQDAINAMVNENIEVHAIGYGGTESTMNNIITATGGTFSNAGGGGSNVQSALEDIADSITSRFGTNLSTTLQTGADNNGDNQRNLSIPFDYTSTGLGIDGTSVDTQADSLSSLDTLKTALERVRDGRAETGALYQRLLHTYENEANEAASEQQTIFRLTDADLAEETAKMTSENIKSQVGLASMAQARTLSLTSMRELMAS